MQLKDFKVSMETMRAYMSLVNFMKLRIFFNYYENKAHIMPFLVLASTRVLSTIDLTS